MNAMTYSSTILFVLITAIACSPKQSNKQSDQDVKQANYPSAAYDFNEPNKIYKLDPSLSEISGIAFAPGDSGNIYAQEDESGTLYEMRLGDESLQKYTFAEAGDYEDIALSNKQSFILTSHGDLIQFNLAALKSGETKDIRVIKDLLPKGEYEGLAFNAAQDKLMVLCKECKVDKDQETVSLYELQVEQDNISLSKTISLDESAVSAILGNKKKWRPSALAQHPASKAWYILSSVNKSMVVLDDQFLVKSAYKLTNKVYTQPEGIAFDPQLNLWISNEAGSKKGEATLLQFKP